MEKEKDGTYAVSFVPDECGPYNVSIKYGDKDVIGSPFILQAHPTGEVRLQYCLKMFNSNIYNIIYYLPLGRKM